MTTQSIRLKDATFEIRGQFYLDRLAITNLEHSVELNDLQMIVKHKAALSGYISSSALPCRGQINT